MLVKSFDQVCSVGQHGHIKCVPCHFPAGSFLLYIAQCYEELNDKENALENYLNSASIWMSEYGIEDEDVQESIINAKRLAKELGKEKDLPEWMK